MMNEIYHQLPSITMAIQTFTKNFKGCKPGPQYLDTVTSNINIWKPQNIRLIFFFSLAYRHPSSQIVGTIPLRVIHVSEKYKTKAETATTFQLFNSNEAVSLIHKTSLEQTQEYKLEGPMYCIPILEYRPMWLKKIKGQVPTIKSLSQGKKTKQKKTLKRGNEAMTCNTCVLSPMPGVSGPTHLQKLWGSLIL